MIHVNPKFALLFVLWLEKCAHTHTHTYVCVCVYKNHEDFNMIVTTIMLRLTKSSDL